MTTNLNVSRKIAIIRMRPIGFAISTEKMLREIFSEDEFDILDVEQILKSNPFIAFINIFYTAKEFGLSKLLSRKGLRERFLGTTYIASQLRKLVTKKLQEKDYKFSFQIQSLFDASITELPNFVYTDHTHLANLWYPDFDKKRLRSPQWIEMEKQIYHNAVYTFTWGSNIAKSVTEFYDCPPEKVGAVGVGSNAIVPDQENMDKSYNMKTILFVGLDWERKGGPLLVEAFAKVLEKHPDAKLLIVGCEPVINLPNCQVMGRRPVEEIHEFYKQASIFCMPTTREPFGIVYIEAMQYSLPVVATRIGAIPDFVRENENGYLIEIGDLDQLVYTLNKLLDDPELCKQFGKRGYQIAQENYTWKKVGEKIRNKIESLT